MLRKLRRPPRRFVRASSFLLASGPRSFFCPVGIAKMPNTKRTAKTMPAGASQQSPESSVNFLSEEEKEEEPELFENLNLAGGRYGKVFRSRQTPSPGPVVLEAPSATSLRLTVPGRWLERGELTQLSTLHSGLTEAENGGRQWLCTAEGPFPRL